MSYCIAKGVSERCIVRLLLTSLGQIEQKILLLEHVNSFATMQIHIKIMTCQFSAYLIYSEIFSLFQLKSCFDLNMAASCLSVICTNTLSRCA